MSFFMGDCLNTLTDLLIFLMTSRKDSCSSLSSSILAKVPPSSSSLVAAAQGGFRLEHRAPYIARNCVSDMIALDTFLHHTCRLVYVWDTDLSDSEEVGVILG